MGSHEFAELLEASTRTSGEKKEEKQPDIETAVSTLSPNA
jgi:hypothetical protein